LELLPFASLSSFVAMAVLFRKPHTFRPGRPAIASHTCLRIGGVRFRGFSVRAKPGSIPVHEQPKSPTSPIPWRFASPAYAYVGAGLIITSQIGMRPPKCAYAEPQRSTPLLPAFAYPVRASRSRTWNLLTFRLDNPTIAYDRDRRRLSWLGELRLGGTRHRRRHRRFDFDVQF